VGTVLFSEEYEIFIFGAEGSGWKVSFWSKIAKAIVTDQLFELVENIL
jgi:hypothetical protein